MRVNLAAPALHALLRADVERVAAPDAPLRQEVGGEVDVGQLQLPVAGEGGVALSFTFPEVSCSRGAE